MDQELQKPEPKILEVEIILIGLFYLILDILDFIPLVGDITDIIVAPMGYYYWVKGLNGVTFIVAEIIEAIPGAQEFPFIRIITWGITVWIDRHPALEAAVAPVLAIEGVLEGDLAGAEGAAGGELGYSAQAAGAAEASANANVLEMTQTESGVYGYQPATEAGTGASAEGSSSTESNAARPSDASTERGNPENKEEQRKLKAELGEEEDGFVGLPDESDDDTEERLRQEKEEQVKKRYEELVTPETEQNPIDVTLKKELGNVVPINQARKPAPPPPAPRHQGAIAGSISREQAKLQKAKEERKQLDSIKAPEDVVGDDIAKAA